jgi:hypothetical protein
MIDDPRKADLLIGMLKESLPIQATITESLARTLAEKSPDAAIPAKCNVVDILYTGDMGGILCALDIEGTDTKTVHLVSLTHLTFDRRVPLSREIVAYQRHRIKKLKQQNDFTY